MVREAEDIAFRDILNSLLEKNEQLNNLIKKSKSRVKFFLYSFSNIASKVTWADHEKEIRIELTFFVWVMKKKGCPGLARNAKFTYFFFFMLLSKRSNTSWGNGFFEKVWNWRSGKCFVWCETFTGKKQQPMFLFYFSVS